MIVEAEKSLSLPPRSWRGPEKPLFRLGPQDLGKGAVVLVEFEAGVWKDQCARSNGRSKSFLWTRLALFGLHDSPLSWLWLAQSAPPSSTSQGPVPSGNTFIALII